MAWMAACALAGLSKLTKPENQHKEDGRVRARSLIEAMIDEHFWFELHALWMCDLPDIFLFGSGL